jgi:hypothetical protein
MILIALIAGALLPVYLFVLLGTGAITLTLLNCVGVALISLFATSVVVMIATLSTYKGGK